MTAGFPSLRDDDIDPGVDGSTSFGDIAAVWRTMAPASWAIGSRGAGHPRRRHDPDTRVETLPEPFLYAASRGLG